MNKILLFLLLTLLPVNAFPEEPITVSYEFCTDPMLRKLITFQGIQYMSIQVHGVQKGKRCNLVRVDCKDGKLTYDTPLRFQAPDSAIIIEAFAQSVHPDTANIMLDLAGMSSARIYPVKSCKQHILMETLTDKTQHVTDTIPLFAYTTGKKEEFTYQGKKVTGTDFCGVRYSKTNPGEWKDKFGITDYFYYILCFDPE